jgi:5'-nucleotidase
LPFNRADYVHYEDVTESFRKTYEELKPKVDVVVAITHLNEEEDLELAETVPGIPVFLGGHDHVHMSHYVENTIITKADANAKTVYIHRFAYHPTAKVTTVRSSLKKIDQTIADDPATRAVVEKWQGKAGDMMQNMGYDPGQELMTTQAPLVCTEAYIRSQPTNYGKLTVEAFEGALPGADVYLINSGSMRLDDNLTGTVTSYDILRTFPYGGPMVRMNVPGQTLRRILQIGLVSNRGEGGYFQIGDQVSGSGNGWLIKGEPIKDDKTYNLVLPEFVAQGKEAGLALFSEYPYDKQDFLEVAGGKLKNDVRDIMIWYLGNNR